tara:strand:+ start:55 stop:318 length:264 start_codon:yes stop_codon:yes gene_type:complete
VIHIEEVTLLVAHDGAFAIDTIIDKIKLGNEKNHFENSKPIMDGFIILDHTCADITTIRNKEHQAIMKKNYKHEDLDKFRIFNASKR